METIKIHDRGAGVEDVQRRLADLGYLPVGSLSGSFDFATQVALKAFCEDHGLEPVEYVDQQVWSRLVDASFQLGDRNLFLRVPFFHGHDVEVLQQALSILGFSTNGIDGIFGAHTEEALRRFQLNMGLPSDGIAGSMTFRTLSNLAHSWRDKDSEVPVTNMSFSRAAAALEDGMLCLYGTEDFPRLVAARMSNLALATNPNSKVSSAESLSVMPSGDTRFLQILGPTQQAAPGMPVVEYEPADSLAFRLTQAFEVVGPTGRPRVGIRVPSESWSEAGPDRSAQHYAIELLDAVCTATLALQGR